MNDLPASATASRTASRREGGRSDAEPGFRRMIVDGKRLVRDGVDLGDQRLVVEARVLFDGATEFPALAALAHYHAAYADYRLALLKREVSREERLAHLQQAITHLQRSLEADPASAECHALLAVCQGIQMGYRPILTLRDGPGASRAMGRARELDPNNPRVWLLHALSLATKPMIVGGNQRAAQRAYETAVELFPRWVVPSELHPEWGHAEAYAMLGMMHYRAKNRTAAREAFERALAVSPAFAIVRDALLHLKREQGPRS